MEQFVEIVLLLVFDGVEDPAAPKWMHATVFATVCSIFFTIFVIIDVLNYVYQKLTSLGGGDSLMGIRHGWRTAAVLVVGLFAAWLVGLITYILQAVQFNVQAAAIVGLTWPFVYAKLLSGMKARGEDVQIPTEEE